MYIFNRNIFSLHTGDPLGTVIETSINNPESMFHQPGGCGEQNMMRLAPTLYILRYLKTTGKLTPSMEEKGYRFIRDGTFLCFL